MMQRLRKWLIRSLDGIPNEEVLTKAVSHLFNTIGEDDILKEKDGVWTIGNKPMPDATRRLVISETKTFLSTMLWRVLQIDIKYKANKAMFERSRSDIDLTAGKLWLYILDCIATRLKSLAEGSGTFNEKK